MFRTNTYKLILTALFAAQIFIFTRVSFPVGSSGAYIHMGDVFIFIAAVMLPFPGALFAGAIGAGLADITAGYPMWAPFTVVIKPLMALCFTSRCDIVLKPIRNRIAPFAAGTICIVGYVIAKTIIYGDFRLALVEIPLESVQFIVSVLLFFLAAAIIDKQQIKRRLIP